MTLPEQPYHERIQAAEPIPYYEPWLGEEELRHVTEAIRNNWISEGPKTAEFERRIAEIWGVKHVISVSNCTAGLIISLKALGLQPGDEVIAPAFTFIATVNAIYLAGMKPVLVDVDERTFNIDPSKIEAAITPRTKAIMPVHLFGQPADIEMIMEIAKRHSLRVVEDAAQGVGVRFKGRSVGSFGDFGNLSFFTDKSITTGEGGVVMTDSEALATEIQYWKNDGRIERGIYHHVRIGYNFRVTDIQMAVGLGQLEKLDRIVQRKIANEGRYRERLGDLDPVRFSYADPRGTRVPHRVNILVDDPAALETHLRGRGVGCRRFFHPIHMQPCYDGFFQGSYSGAEHAFAHGLSLPSSPLLTDDQIDQVSAAIHEFFRA